MYSKSRFANLTNTVIICFVLAILPSVCLSFFAAPTESGKTFVFLALLIPLYIITAFWLAPGESFNIKITVLDVCLFAIIAYILTNRYFLHSELPFSLRFYDLIGLSLFYIVLRNVPVRLYSAILFAMMTGAILQDVHALLQLVGYLPSNNANFPITGSFFNPGPFAGYLAGTGIISAGVLLYTDDLRAYFRRDTETKLHTLIVTSLKYVAITNLIFLIVLLPALRSRSAWLAFTTGALFCLCARYQWLQKGKHLKVSSKLIYLLSGLILLALLTTAIFSFKQRSSSGRMLIYKATASIIRNNPFIGVGFDRFQSNYMNYQASLLANGGEPDLAIYADNTQYAFSEPLQLLAENGLIGLLLAACVFVSCIWAPAGKSSAALKNIALAVMLSLLCFGLFTYSAPVLPVKLVMVTSLALIAHLQQGGIPALIPARLNFTLARSTTPILASLLFITTLLCLPGLWKFKSAYELWQESQRVYSIGSYERSLTTFKQAYPFFSENGEFLMQYGKALNMAHESDKAIIVLLDAERISNNTVVQTTLGDSYKALGAYQSSERAYLTAIDMTPAKSYPYYLLAKLYKETEQREKAIYVAKKVLALPVKVPSTAIQQIRNEMTSLINSPL